jgi:hypothetical protein
MQLGSGLPWPAAAAPAHADFLADCVRTAYDIAADDARLRQALGAADPGAAFDQLRKSYPPRHEFHRYQVIGIPEQKRDLKFRLQGLGFQVG